MRFSEQEEVFEEATKEKCNASIQESWWQHWCGRLKGHEGNHRCKYNGCTGSRPQYEWWYTKGKPHANKGILSDTDWLGNKQSYKRANR